MKKAVLVLFLLGTVGATGAFAGAFVLGQSTDVLGLGFGNITTILSLHYTCPNSPVTEIGAVAPLGASNLSTLNTNFGGCSGSVVLCGDAVNQSNVITNADLVALGITSSSMLGLLYNVNQQGSNLNTFLNTDPAFTVYFYDSGKNLLDSASYTGRSAPFPPVANGQGGAGYLFTLDGSLIPSFSSIAYLGMSGTIGNANDGADNWSIVNINNPVPEPATFGLIGRAW